jgi:serine/threonine protein kinase/tetratricopeptide (TPR) repeat protein
VLTLSQVAESPTRIGPYRILYELGRGGMGVVYRAVREDGPELALKIPSRDLAHHFGWLRREIHALGRLRHPGVVRILDEGIEQGVPWYAMELLHGQSLDAALGLRAVPFDKTTEFPALLGLETPRLHEGRATVRDDLPRALTLMYRLARVLAYVHSHGLVHRDLKPENVFVRAGDRPVLVDFGLVAHFHAHTSREVLEVAGRTGTAIYIAPEQVRGDLVDARADLYSFGVMLYEIVTGRPPFDAATVAEIHRMHLHEAPAAPSRLTEGVPAGLEQLILGLLQKNRAARPGYAEDVAQALIDAGATPDVTPEPATPPYLYRPDIVGRRETIDDANASIRALQQGTGAFLLLGGVSGIGKTSVAAVLAREAALRQIRVITGGADAVGGGRLHPLRPLLRDIADRCLDKPDITERVLGARLPVLADLEPALAALNEGGPTVPPQIAARRLLADLAETLAAFARERPLLLVLDDLQWADEVTLRFLASLGREFFEGLPLVIVGTYRADETGPDLRGLLAGSSVRNIVLGRLDDASVGEIVRSMLAAPDAPPSFLEFLAKQTEGNPFFIAEYLRSAVAEEFLVREEGRWRLIASDERYDTLPLPGTVRDLVAHRLARLSALARRAAEAASVIGRESSEELFLEVFAEPVSDAFDALVELGAQQIFESSADRIRFAHDKLREAAYASLDEQRRRDLHQRAALAIERSCRTDEELRRHDAELARHYDTAGIHDKAVEHYARAAEGAVGTGACREAIALMNRALVLDSSSPRDDDASGGRQQRAHWERVLSFAHFGLGDLPGSSEHARVSLQQAGVVLPDTPRGWQMRLGREATHHLLHRLMPRAGRRQTEDGALRDIAMAAQKFSEARYYTDEKTVMLASGLIAVNAAERVGDATGRIHTYANFGAVTSGVGMNRIARHYYDKARTLAQDSNDIGGLAHIGYTSAVLYITTCDWKSCARYFNAAIAAAMQTGDHQLIEMNLMARGFHELYRGKIEAAIETFTSVRDRAHKRHNLQHEAWGHTWRACGLLLRDRGEDALQSLDAALEMLTGLGDNARLSSYSLRCQTLLHSGRLDDALDAADVTAAAVAKIPGIIWERYRGLSAPAEVYLEACERRGGETAKVAEWQRAADVLLRRLEVVARRMPLALPVSQRLRAVRAYLDGDAKSGEKLLRRSIASSVRLGMPIEEGIGLYELARRSASAERRALQTRARTTLTRIGCDLYLRKLVEGA